MTSPLHTYHRDYLVIAMYGLTGDWSQARSYSDMPRDQVVEEIEDLLASGVVPVKLRPAFIDCLNGEKLRLYSRVTEAA